MSLETFQKRMADNVPGKFYVGDECMDCDLCRQMAPENFARNDEGGYSYLKKQPETDDELARCREAVEGCCTSTIFEDGDCFDWAAIPAPTPYHLTTEGQARILREQQEQHNCCCKRKRGDERGSSPESM